MGSTGVGEKESQSVLQHAGETSTALLKCGEEITENVASTHRDPSGGNRNTAADELRGVSQEAFQARSAERGPDESFGDVLVGGIEAVQIGVGLPFLEHELHLPAKAVQLADALEWKALTVKIGAESGHPLLLAGQHDESEEMGLLSPAERHVEIEGAPLVLSETGTRLTVWACAGVAACS